MSNVKLLIIAISFIVVLLILCATFIKACKLKLEATIRLHNLTKNGRDNMKVELSPSGTTSEKESDKDGINEKTKHKNVFIVHSAKNLIAKNRWKELSNNFKSLGYEVFEDEDSEGENDISYCKDHLEGSDIIIILVGDERPLLNTSGVFYHEIEHISRGLAKGKYTYVCSYGVQRPLDDAIKKCDDPKLNRILNEIQTKVTQHCFDLNEMEQLAKTIDGSYKKATKNDSAAKNSYREISL